MMKKMAVIGFNYTALTLRSLQLFFGFLVHLTLRDGIVGILAKLLSYSTKA